MHWNELESIAICVCEHRKIQKRELLVCEWDRYCCVSKYLFCFAAIEILDISLHYLAGFMDCDPRKIYEIRSNHQLNHELRYEILYIKHLYETEKFFPYERN